MIEDSDSNENTKRNEEEVDVDELPPQKKIYPAKRFCCFLTEAGRSLNFILLQTGLSDTEISQTIDLIRTHLGQVSTSLKDVGSHFAVLISDKATFWNYYGDTFKLSYIDDCIEAGKLLNISHYLKEPSKRYVANFDYMSIVYHRSYSWETIPDVYRLPVSMKQSAFRTHRRQNSSDSDSSITSECSFASAASTNRHHSNKHSHSSYTRAEKEAMLRYVIERKGIERVKGKAIFKEMEMANICPIRTWQSLKDHFQRTLSKEINTFMFLTPNQRQQLQLILLPYRK